MSHSIAEQKKTLRRQACADLQTLPVAQLRMHSEMAWRRAIAAGFLPDRSTVMLYAPIHGIAEIDLTGLATDLRARHCRLCVPRIDPATRTMSLAQVANLTDDLIPDTSSRFRGLKMARPDAPTLSQADLDVVVVPGVVFDASGARLGRGAGYYDRFLAALPATKPVRLVLTFDEQIVDCVPTEPHDQRVHVIVTPTRIIRPG